MPHVITSSCCLDGDCVSVCPVDCIHPGPAEAGAANAEMFYIDPSVCIDCGACVEACPVSAITTDYQLSGDVSEFQHLADQYLSSRSDMAGVPRVTATETTPVQVRDRGLKVAVVGAGASGMYAVASLLERTGGDVEIDLIERLPTPWGLVRYGVAPDHQRTKQISDRFLKLARHPSVTCYFDLDVGGAVSHSDLTSTHHAVIYAVGASAGRLVDLPGSQLRGSHTAADIVAWYNGYPDLEDVGLDLSGPRAVIIGNGNVALDIARLLTADADYLSRTDMPSRVREALHESAVRWVGIIGRRGLDDAAFTTPQLLDLVNRPALTVRAQRTDPSPGTMPTPLRDYRRRLLRDADARRQSSSDPIIQFDFWSRPRSLTGDDRVTGIVVDDPRISGPPRTIECALVVSAVGFDRAQLPGLPLTSRGELPHHEGRVQMPEQGTTLPGTYAVGWFKRGPSGQLGSNKGCSDETVKSLLEDLRAQQLAEPTATFSQIVGPHLDLDDWLAIDAFELSSASGSGGPRRKLLHRQDMRQVARGRRAEARP